MMGDDSTELPPPTDDTAEPQAGSLPVRQDPVAPQPRPRESWEPQQRETRRPDFVSRLTKTTDLPTEIAKERQKSKLGEHRLAALHWEEELIEEDEAGSPEEVADELAQDEVVEAAGISRAQMALLAGLGVVVLALGATWFAKSLLIGKGVPAVPEAIRPEDPGEFTGSALGLPEPEYNEAMNAMRRFLESPTAEDLRPVIRDPERVWPLLEAYVRRNPWKPFIVRRLPARNEVHLNRGLMAGAVEVNDYERFVVAMERTPDGMKVDWEAFAGQGEMTWEEFIEKRPRVPVLMRVSLRPDDFFNQDFRDSSAYTCFRLAAHHDAHRLYAYAKRGSPVNAQLASRIRASQRIMPTIKIRYPEHSTSPDQVEITELVADGWIVTDKTRVNADLEAEASEK